MPLKKLLELEEPAGLRLPTKDAAMAFVAGVLFVIAPIPQIVSDRSSAFTLLLSALIPCFSGIIVMVHCLLRSGIKNALQIKLLHKKDWLFFIGRTCLIILLSAVVNLLWKQLLTALNIPFQDQQNLLILAKSLDTKSFVLFAFLVVVIVPVAEELLFRRILYTGLLEFGKAAAFFGTAAIFAAAHLFLAGLPGLFVLGLGFQWMYLYRQNLTVSIAAHSLLNACTVCAVLIQRGIFI